MSGKNKKSNPKKVVKYRKPINLNLGLLVFGVLFIYIIAIIIMYFKSDHVTPYEVTLGSLAVDNTYVGVALREESVVDADYSGYINYYAREDEKVAAGSMVYTIDSTGKLADMLSDKNGEKSSLTDADLTELKAQISEFASEFDPREFDATYNFKSNIEGTVLKLANYKILSGIDAINTGNYSDAVSFGYSPMSGVLVYSTDGYEDYSPSDISSELIDNPEYLKSQFHSGDLIAEGDKAYKLITSENWTIVIEIDDERAEELKDESYVEVKFLKNNYTAWAACTILRQNGGVYLQLDFNNSMINFATYRFIEIELLLNTQTGLKIPVSSIVEREFYLIPEAYYTEGGNSGNPGFIRECYLEDGSKSTEFVEASVYSLVDGEYYVDESVFNVGDALIMPETGDIYNVSKQASLIGVYNINKGYADFKQITILAENDEYAIVRSNTEYGLSVYDHIVLKGDAVNDNDFIYE